MHSVGVLHHTTLLYAIFLYESVMCMICIYIILYYRDKYKIYAMVNTHIILVSDIYGDAYYNTDVYKL